MIEKIAPRTTTTAVLDVIRPLILNGHYPPGSQLRENQIAEELGVSRAPLREALSCLQEEGLVTKIPFKGSYVAEVSQEAINEIGIVRRLVEGHVIEKALPVLLTSEAANLQRFADDLAEAAETDDFEKALDAHLQLHRLIYVCADNEVLSSMWMSWESQLRLYFAEDLRNLFNPKRSAEDHLNLVKIIQTGDLEKITHAITEHVHRH